MSVSKKIKKRFQLYGYFDNDEWKDGILAANFRYFSALPREGEPSTFQILFKQSLKCKVVYDEKERIIILKNITKPYTFQHGYSELSVTDKRRLFKP